uniref:Uncharacterized protein n=1 Tax=Chromera velia CCMP2878 TaxID=1169474 RepID=A0A0G4FS40_9ALVE|eukprot:Cvel_18309.t1-p1 / transcript=Cvel_18309.t1 / gene=Cvel_18309 / organism=Chromera_velia_CCMP2878 / gene_product=hypothetical protein / transcript_product=hypothetical protein / location=Cvel_scaffold1510:30621-32424(-) / protein_length=111 / sequence_SO=supercontig / SO=protein_coding / is_pseudo=false
MDKDGFVIPTDFRERFAVGRGLNIAHAMFSDVKFTVKILELKELTDDHRKKADIGIFPDDSLITNLHPPGSLESETLRGLRHQLLAAGLSLEAGAVDWGDRPNFEADSFRR